MPQSVLYRRSVLVMSVVNILFFLTTIVIIVVFSQKLPKNEDFDCGPYKCLIPDQCENIPDSDFSYDCGADNFGNIKICCKPKVVTLGGDRNGGYRYEDFFTDDCGSATFSNRIANGQNAAIGQFPWMALLGYTTKRIKTPQFLCGGTLINDRYILTAAHCTVIPGMKLVSVRLGEVNLKQEIECEEEQGVKFCADPPLNVPVEKVITHEKYNNVTIKNDIALVRLANNLTQFSEFVRPVCLPFQFQADNKFVTDKKFVISGWGKTTGSSIGVSTVLQYASVKGWDLKTCDRALPKKVKPINDLQLCATGDNFTEACKGDSGGPLTWDTAKSGELKTTQIGIVSFKSLNTCGSEEIPTVFTRIDKYLDWILANMAP